MRWHKTNNNKYKCRPVFNNRHTQTVCPNCHEMGCAGPILSDSRTRVLKSLQGHLQKQTSNTSLHAFVPAASAYEKLLHIFDDLTVGIAFFDREFNVIHINDEFQLMIENTSCLQIEGNKLHIEGNSLVDRNEELMAIDAHFLAFSVVMSDYILECTFYNEKHDFVSLYAAQQQYLLVCRKKQRAKTVVLDKLEHFYGLTPNELKLSEYLSQGVSLKEIADKMNISYETARSYLKSIFRKTNTARQTEFLSMFIENQTASIKR